MCGLVRPTLTSVVILSLGSLAADPAAAQRPQSVFDAAQVCGALPLRVTGTFRRKESLRLEMGRRLVSTGT